MRTILLSLLVLTCVVFTATPTIASSPAIAGEIEGIEICPQFACEAAIFTGNCECVINNRQTIGVFWVSIQHDPLPPEFNSSAISGGKWNLTTLRGKFSGRVGGGTITNNGNDTFTVTATLRIQKGGKGNMVVTGVLDHTEFPPTFEGKLLQNLIEPVATK